MPRPATGRASGDDLLTERMIMGKDPVEAWMCDDCGTVFDDEGGALECCPNVSDGFVCSICGSFFSSWTVASGCCETDSPSEPPRASVWELEAAGQLRLLA